MDVLPAPKLSKDGVDFADAHERIPLDAGLDALRERTVFLLVGSKDLAIAPMRLARLDTELYRVNSFLDRLTIFGEG
jgi:hypothetical protein